MFIALEDQIKENFKILIKEFNIKKFIDETNVSASVTYDCFMAMVANLEEMKDALVKC